MLKFAVLALAGLVAADAVIEKELQMVTCTSAIKLMHVPSGYRLHSHPVGYASGSGQQSVTATG